MINSVNFYNLNKNISSPCAKQKASFTPAKSLNFSGSKQNVEKTSVPALNQPATSLFGEEQTKMYNEILGIFATNEAEKVSPKDNVLRQKKLDALLKNGVLLNSNSNDNTTTLENLHKIVTNQRAGNIDGAKIAGEVIDTLYNPASITQKFGDVPKEAQSFILNKDEVEAASKVKTEGSGTCVAASIEFHMANKMPAEFARWIEGLSSPNLQVEKKVDLDALSKNKMDAIWLLKEFETPLKGFNWNSAQLVLKPDSNAIARAQIQDNFWDTDERTIVDVLMQSTLMNLGSQQTYNSLTDTRSGKFNANPQGLIEYEKTYTESIVGNHERNSAIYQIVDEDQNLNGWTCDMKNIQDDITRAIDSNEDVIVGYVLTAKECGENGTNPNKIVNGHEITIVDYKKDSSGKITFICNDTDDDKPNYVEYSADYLLPKIHHASYPVEILEYSKAS